MTINDENWAWLQSLARPLEDTVDDVLDRLRLGERAVREEEPPIAFRGPVARTPTAVRLRLEKGRKVQIDAFKRPILLALREAGGQDRPADLLPHVERRMKHLLQDVDYERLGSGSVRWEKTANWARYELVQEGLIDGTDFGVWRLTEKGRSAIGEGVGSTGAGG